MRKTISVEYFAILRDERGKSGESLETEAETFRTLYEELKAQHGFSLDTDSLKVIANNSLSDWDAPLGDGDAIVFMPPIAGG